MYEYTKDFFYNLSTLQSFYYVNTIKYFRGLQIEDEDWDD